ncbi:MAG TPA: hypothetical protein VNI01_09690 [Elusimicrobiota bacterium]|jgi:hypothetical protein|nr:hypothetical protein [Elusimicrobiota bacterium]
MSAPAADNKHAALVAVVLKATDPMSAKLDKSLAGQAEIQKALATLAVTVNSVLSRLDTLKDSLDVKMAEAPLPVRESKTASRGRSGGAKKTGTAPFNIMTFFRWAVSTNYEGAREKWCPESVVLKHENLAPLKKCESTKGANPSEWWSKLAHAEWKSLAEADRSDVRRVFDAYKEGQKADGAPPAEVGNGELAEEGY